MLSKHTVWFSGLCVFAFLASPVLGQMPVESALTPAESDTRVIPEAKRAADEVPMAHQLAMAINQFRIENGLPPLKYNEQLVGAAAGHATSMGVNNFYAECDVVSLLLAIDRMTKAGYMPMASTEIHGRMVNNANDQLDDWIANEAGTLRSTEFRDMGIGYYHDPEDNGSIALNEDDDVDCVIDSYDDPYFHYWVGDFGRIAEMPGNGPQDGLYPLIIEAEAYRTVNPTVTFYLYQPDKTGFVEMRFRNAEEPWSEWMPYEPETNNWTMPKRPGLVTIEAEIRVDGETLYTASDTIVNAPPCISINVLLDDVGEWGMGGLLELIELASLVCEPR